MKNKIFFGILLSTLSLVSCKKDFLDRQPLDELVDATFYTNEETLQLAVNGTYAYIKGKNTVDMENMGDNTLNSSFGDQYLRIGSGNYANDHSTLNTEWATDYDGIRRCNAFLENYQKATGRETVKESMAAEVRFTRAYLYFYLTQFFGDVQLITKTLLTTDPEVYGTRNKKSEVVDFILKELDEVAVKLPHTQTGVNLGRVTKGAALALKARVALYNQKYDVAEQAAKSVMDLNIYQLYTTGTPATAYNDFFTYKGKLKNGTNKETILARLYSEEALSYHNMSREAQVPDQASRWNPTKSLVDAYLCSDGLPINKSPLYKETHYDSIFKNRDPRMTQTILQPGAAWGGRQDGRNLSSTATWGTFMVPKWLSNKQGSVTITGFYFTKYVELSTVALVGRDENDIHLIRFPEVLLTYAEARLEQGTLTQADIDLTINKIRQRVGMRPMKLTELAANGLDLRTEVRRERRVEMAMEGQRYFDILRWKQGNLLAQDIKGMKKSLAFRPSDVANLPADPQGYIIVNSGRTFTDPKNYLWPISLTQFQRNPNLGQNSGW